MANITLDEIRAAFDSTDVTVKNRALRRAYDDIANAQIAMQHETPVTAGVWMDGASHRREFSVTLDIEKIAGKHFTRAFHNKAGKAKMLGGAVVIARKETPNG